MNRRSVLVGTLASLVIPPALAGTLPQAMPQAPMTAKERQAFHLAEYKRACEELDPMIGHWQDLDVTDSCGGGAMAYRVSGRYEGDGLYETGQANALGLRSRYQVILRPGDLIDGERAFSVTCPGDRMIMTETRLETFIGRRLS
ncbi:MAG: hypothetical protein Devi2KO_31640 [Devosia indica]